ncbi:hypothetical protein KVR01_007341 [Diaporthe batatas]|uniref:uncharacterized protein n=1 Tax=Diaporthe batatas TaxID=748121 RepID=UPI001D03DD95|nr:uncharacterized protein KVR01_007341 [Diaporthe batatas]KAG8162863.1 hypothetical protein KVR01_007341 [Diaporthe batatas]
MWAYDDGRGRRTRDIPSSRPANYYDDAYERAPPRSSRHAYPEPQPKHSSNDRHRRKSAMVDPEGPRPRRNTHGGVNVVASDDGSGYPYGGDGARDVYGSSYPGKKSRHDVEHKTGDRDRRFREKRGTWETDEAENLRRAKSYSPRRAAREAEAPRRVSPQAPKTTWPEDDYAAQAGAGSHHRSSKKHGSKAPQYYEDDPYASYYASQAPPRSKKPDREAPSAYDYGAPSADDMPRPPMGEHAPYKSSPLSSYPEAGEKQPSKHHRKQRDKDYYGTGYDDYTAAPPKAGTSYDRAGYGAAAAAAEEEAPPRRSRHGKHHDDRAAPAGMDDYGQPAQPQARGRHRNGDYGDADPYSSGYDRAPPSSRPRHRQSMPPQPRAAYPGAADDPYDADPYGQAAPRRRATSVNYGRQGQRDRYGYGGGGGGGGGGDPYYDDGYGGRGGGSPSGSGGSGGAAAVGAGGKKGNKKSKAYAQQAGKLFMTHAVPVIKKEAVPFLTKAAQAYFEQQKR